METFTWKKHSDDLLKNMGDFYRYKLNLDCSFLVEGQYLGGHKLILSAASPFFEELFLNHSGKKSIPLKHIKYNDFKSVLEFIYFGIVNIPLNHVESFIEAATSLQIPLPQGEHKVVNISSISATEENSQIIDNNQDDASSLCFYDENNKLLYDDMTERLRTISLSERILHPGIKEDMTSIQADVPNTPNMERKKDSEVMNNSDPSRMSINSYYSCITSMQEKREEFANPDISNKCETNLMGGFEAQETFGYYSNVDKGLLKIVEETNEVCQKTIEVEPQEIDVPVANDDTGKGMIDSLRQNGNNYGWALSQYEADPSTSKENQSPFYNQKRRPSGEGGFQEQTLKAGGDCKENEPINDNGQMFIPSDFFSFNDKLIQKADSGFHLKGNEPNLDSASVSSLKLRQIKKEKIKKAQAENPDLKICLCEYLPLVSSSHFIIVKHHKRSHRRSHRDKRKKKEKEKQRKRDKEARSVKRGSKQHCHSSKLHHEGSSHNCELQPNHSQKSSKRKQPEEGEDAGDEYNTRANTLSREKSLKVEERVRETSRARDFKDFKVLHRLSASPSKMPSTSQDQLPENIACNRVVTFPVAEEVETPDYLVRFPSSEESGSETAAPSVSFTPMEVGSANPLSEDQTLGVRAAAPVTETLFHIRPATTPDVSRDMRGADFGSAQNRGSTAHRSVVFNKLPTQTFERARSFCVVSRVSNKPRQVLPGPAGRDNISRGRYAKAPSSTCSSHSDSRSRSRSVSRVGGCTRIIIEEIHESDTYRLGRTCDEWKKMGVDEVRVVGDDRVRRRMMKRTVSSSSNRSFGVSMWGKEEEQRWKRQEEERRKREEEVKSQREEERKRHARLQKKQDEERKRLEEQRNRREEEEKRRYLRYERERLREEEALQKRLEQVRRGRLPKREDDVKNAKVVPQRMECSSSVRQGSAGQRKCAVQPSDSHVNKDKDGKSSR